MKQKRWDWFCRCSSSALVRLSVCVKCAFFTFWEHFILIVAVETCICRFVRTQVIHLQLPQVIISSVHLTPTPWCWWNLFFAVATSVFYFESVHKHLGNLLYYKRCSFHKKCSSHCSIWLMYNSSDGARAADNDGELKPWRFLAAGVCSSVYANSSH